MKRTLILPLLLTWISYSYCYAQNNKTEISKSGRFSLGGRNTFSSFNNDGVGLGTGGQFRIQLSDRVNTEWFADYISITESEVVRSQYYHIGWSVLYYPIARLHYPKLFQPYILAGHCFDYNIKTAIQDPNNSKSRWGSAVQAGLGTHLNLTEKFDISLSCQYMIHLTTELVTQINGSNVTIDERDQTSVEGHLLSTISLNYKLFRLWKK